MNNQHRLLLERGMDPKLNNKFESIPDDAALHPDEIANLLNFHKETVRRWCRTGQLPAYEFGGKYVIVGSDFKDFMRTSKVLNKAQKQILRAVKQ